MAKLKSLRAARGSYGRVAAKGIVDVDEDKAAKLKKTGHFVDATEADIKAAQKAQSAALAVRVKGVSPGFTAIPEKPAGADRLQAMIDRGDISADDARRLSAMQIELAPEEIRALIQRDLAEASARIEADQGELDARAAKLDARETALDDRAADLDRRQADLDAAAPAAPEAKATDTAADDKADAAAPAAADDKPAAPKKAGK